MDAIKTLPFGTVVRRRHDGVTVMVLCNAIDYIKTDEIHVSPGAMIGLVLVRGSLYSEDDPSPYWPLHGTCSVQDIQGEDADEWDILP